MKNLSLILNGVLALAVAILYVLHFSSKPVANIETEPSIEVGEEVMTIAPPVIQLDTAATKLPIAFVNLDELNEGYKFIKDAGDAAQKKLDREKKKFDAEKKEVQNEYITFVENAQAGFYKTQEDIKQREEYFGRKQQELMRKEYELESMIEKEMTTINKEIVKRVTDYMTKYSKEFKFSYVLTTGGATSSVLYADESQDITKAILDGLNAEYAATKK